MKKNKLQIVQSFLKEIYESSTKETDSPHNFGNFFYQQGFGTIFLSDEETKRYHEVLFQLIDSYSSDQLMSRKAVEKELRTALFTAFGKPGIEQPPFYDRLEVALKELHAQLSRDVSTYTVFVPIAGATTKGIPFVFGNVRFVIFNESQLLKFKHASRKHRVSASEMDKRHGLIRDLRNTELWESPCAVVRVTAKDSNAAEQIAVRKTQGTLDALNFFTDMTPYQHGCIYMPGARGRVLTTTPILEDSNSWSLPHRIAGPLAPFDFAKLREATNFRNAFKRVHKILKAESLTEVDDILLSAVRWAGRAASEVRDEQAFLWYAIALESAILPAGNTQEVGYRLRMRIAHLLAVELDKRRDVVRLVKDLYKIRSKIVHSGWYELLSTELEQMRKICKISLLRLMTNRSIARLCSKKELEEWFDEHLLR